MSLLEMSQKDLTTKLNRLTVGERKAVLQNLSAEEYKTVIKKLCKQAVIQV